MELHLLFIIIEMECNKGFFPSFPLEQSHHVYGCQNSHKGIFFNKQNSPRFHFY